MHFANRFLYKMKKLTVHQVSKCLGYLKAILMTIGQWLQCLIFIFFLHDLGTLCGIDVYLDVDVDVIYKYLCPVCFLSPHNQEGTLFSMITYMLYPSCFCKIWALCVSWMYLNLSYNLCNLFVCLISKRRPSIGQILIKIKHKVKWMIEVLKTKHLPPLSSYMNFFPSTTKLLQKIRLHMFFTLFVNILKKNF